MRPGMANFAFSPHPRMNEVLRKYDLRDRLQLDTFLQALHYVDSEGSELYDYIPPDVTLGEWDELYDAYLLDESEIHVWREKQTAAHGND